MAVHRGSTSTGSTAAGSQITFNHTVEAWETLLVVRVGFVRTANLDVVSTVKWKPGAGDEQSFTLKGAVTNATNCRVELWYLRNPVVAADQIEITLTGSATPSVILVGACTSYWGEVPESVVADPFRGSNGQQGNATSTSRSFASEIGDEGLDVIAVKELGGTPTEDSGQSLTFMVSIGTPIPLGSGSLDVGGSSEPGAATTMTMGWSWGAVSKQFAFGCASIRAAYPNDLTITQEGIEALAKRAGLRITQEALEAAARRAGVRITQSGLEIAGVRVGLRFTEEGIEILARRAVMRMTSAGIELMALRGVLRFTQQTLEIVSSVSAPVVDVRITKAGIELMSKPDSRSIVPLALPSVLPKLFPMDWEGPAEIETTWLTNVAVSRAGNPERLSLSRKPERLLRFRFKGLHKDLASALLMNIRRFAGGRLMIPLYPDQSRVTSSSGARIFCDSSNRRFFPGGRVVIHSWITRHEPFNIQRGIVSKVDDLGLLLEDPLSGSYTEGARVYPDLDTEPITTATATMVDDETVTLLLVLDEVPGPSALPRLVPRDEHLVESSEFAGKQIIPIDPDWGESLPTVEVQRDTTKQRDGKAAVVDVSPAPASVGFSVTYRGLNRADAFRILRFFDSVRGRARSFWIPAPNNPFEVVELLTTRVDVERFPQIEDVQDFVGHVAVVARDRTVQVAQVDTVVATTNGGTPVWRITFVDPIASVPASLRRVTLAHLVTFDQDAIKERWDDNESVSVSATVVESVLEQDVVVEHAVLPRPNLELLTPTSIANFYAWFSPVSGLWGDPTGTSGAQRINPAEDLNWFTNRVQDPRTRVFHEGDRPYLEQGTGEVRVAHHRGRPFFVTTASVNNGMFLRRFRAGLPPWTNTGGMTMFFPYRRGTDEGRNTEWDASDFIIKQEQGSGVRVLTWNHNAIVQAETAGGADVGMSFSSLFTGMADHEKKIAVMRWDPGVSLRVYANGVLHAEKLVGVATMMPLVAESGSTFFATRFFSVGTVSLNTGGLDPELIDPITFQGWSDVLLYDRALNNAEMNQVGNWLAASLGDVNWTDLV